MKTAINRIAAPPTTAMERAGPDDIDRSNPPALSHPEASFLISIGRESVESSRVRSGSSPALAAILAGEGSVSEDFSSITFPAPSGRVDDVTGMGFAQTGQVLRSEAHSTR